MLTAGISNIISVGLESTYGTPATPVLSIPVAPSAGLKVEQELIGVQGFNGNPAKNKFLVNGKQSISGGYELPVYPRSIMYFLLSAMGKDTVSEVQTDVVFKHTYSELATKPGLTVEQNLGASSVKTFGGYVPSKLKLSCKVGEALNCSIDGLAINHATQGSPITPVFEAGAPFNWEMLDTMTIGGTDILPFATSFELEYDNGLEMFYSMGQLLPRDRYAKGSTLTGKIEAALDDETMEAFDDMVAANGDTALILTFNGATIGSASTYTFKITVSGNRYKSFETKLDEDYNKVTITFEAYQHATDGLLKIELTNLTETL